MLNSALRKNWYRLDSLAFFNRVIDLLFKLLIFFVVLVLAMGLIKMFLEVWSIMVRSELKEACGFIVTNLLTFFIILELFKTSWSIFANTGSSSLLSSTRLWCLFFAKS